MMFFVRRSMWVLGRAQREEQSKRGLVRSPTLTSHLKASAIILLDAVTKGCLDSTVTRVENEPSIPRNSEQVLIGNLGEVGKE